MSTTQYQIDMKHLPDEIVHTICTFLQQQDIAHIRMTARKYRNIGFEHLFRHGRIRMRLIPQHLALLRKVAHHEITRCSIKTLEAAQEEAAAGSIYQVSLYQYIREKVFVRDKSSTHQASTDPSDQQSCFPRISKQLRVD